MKTDALKRRSRFAKPQPMDARIFLQERDLALFEVIDRHGKLPTNYLYELTKHLGTDYNFFQHRLTQLYNGYCDNREHRKAGHDLADEGTRTWAHTCKAHSYLTRDWQQWNNFKARYQPTIYGLTPLAKEELCSSGRGSLFSPERNDPFVHQFMGACISASFELEARRLGIRFISREEILRHPKCPDTTRQKTNPLAIPVSDIEATSLIPDLLFGLEYPDGGFRFFAMEVDRNTETINPRKPVKNSIAKKVRGYVDILKNRTHTKHFGLPNLTVLFVTVNHEHMDRMIAHVKENSERQQPKFLFSAYTAFDETWSVPRETLDVFAPYKTTAGLVDISKK